MDNGFKSSLKVKTLEQSLASGEWHETACALSKKSENAPETRVTFSTLEFRDYPLRLGDNPSVRSGPPLTIAWEHSASLMILIDDYELTRPPRRFKDSMIVPKMIREDWLREEGYSRGEMQEAVQEALIIKKYRKTNSRRIVPIMKLEEGKEYLQHKLRKWIRRSHSDGTLYQRSNGEKEENQSSLLRRPKKILGRSA